MASPMRIAILLLNRGRGSGVVARQQAAGLIEHGHHVIFIHPGMDDGVPGAANREVPLHAERLPVHEYLPQAGDTQRPVSEMSEAEAFRFAGDYQAALEAAAEVDIYVAHHANLTAVATHRVAKSLGVPFAVFVHGTGIEPRHHGGYADAVWEAVAAALKAADGLIVTTRYVRDVLVRPLIDVPEERFLVLPAGVEPAAGSVIDVRRKYGLSGDFVISPGALTELKGPQNVVAASQHYFDLAETVFIGDGPLRDPLEATLGGRGRLLGFVPDEDKAALIAEAAVLAAAPLKREHFGIIYVEALAAGTVPVAYEGGGVADIISPEVGILTERSPRALGLAVRTLLEDRGRRDAMSAAGRKRAGEHFHTDRLLGRLESWLSRL